MTNAWCIRVRVFFALALVAVTLLHARPSLADENCGYDGQPACTRPDRPEGWWGEGFAVIAGWFRPPIYDCYNFAVLDGQSKTCHCPAGLVDTRLSGGGRMCLCPDPGASPPDLATGACPKPPQPAAPSKPTVVTLDAALAAGCLSQSEMEQAYQDVRNDPAVGSITARQIGRKLDGGADGGWMTREAVNDPTTWMYRGTDKPWDLDGFLRGETASRSSSRQIDWKDHGPHITASTATAVVRGLQALAVQSSAEPASQFASMALDFEVASRFGRIVYRFQGSPDSPVIGLDKCALGKEAQFQVRDKTKITNIARFDRAASAPHWERLDLATKQWLPIDSPPKDELRKREELGSMANFTAMGNYFSNNDYLYDDGNQAYFGSFEDCANRCLGRNDCEYFTFAYRYAGASGQYCTLFAASGFQPLPDQSESYWLYQRRR